MEMEIGEVVDLLQAPFVVIEASWQADQSHKLISDLAPTHVIVRDGDASQTHYYLFQADIVLPRLQAGSADIAGALNLTESDAVPLIATSETASRVPTRCIVHEGG